MFFVGVSVLFCALWTSASIRSLILDISSSVLAFLSSNCSGLDYRSVTSRRLRIQGYSRDSLLSLFTPTAPTYGVQQRLRELGLWTVCRLADHNNRSTVYLRRHRGHHAGRPRRPVHRRRPVGIGAFIVSVPRHGRDDARSAVRALANSTPLSRRRLMRIHAVLLSVLSTSVRWRTRLTICWRSDAIIISTFCVLYKHGMTRILSAFVGCALTAIIVVSSAARMPNLRLIL